MRDNGYEACGTERVDMRKRIIARMVDSPSYMAAIPFTVADLRAEGDDEGADELERLAVNAQRRIDAMKEAGDVPPHRRKQSSGASGVKATSVRMASSRDI